MLVFMFASLYSKTALARDTFGMEVYEKYSEQTAPIRTTAFWTMYYSALLYVFQVVVSVFYTFPLTWSYGLFGTLMIVMLISFCHTHAMVKHASILFLPEENIIKMIETELKIKTGKNPSSESKAPATSGGYESLPVDEVEEYD